MKILGVLPTMLSLALAAIAPNNAIAQEKVLYSFGATSADGVQPTSLLVRDAKGNLYGTTQEGGTYNVRTTGAGGTAFELSPAAGGGWTEKVLHSFNGPGPVKGTTGGIQPMAGMIFDAKGNLYGTTYLGGAHDRGIVFELTPGTDGNWTETVLYSFGADSKDGTQPSGSLIFDSKGNLYGTTVFGGATGIPGDGIVFELTPTSGGSWTEKILYSFLGSPNDSLYPGSNLIFDHAGNLYGTAGGGTYQYGTVFELTPETGGNWSERVLYNFLPNGVDGVGPSGGLIFDSKGNLYGMTEQGGAYDPYLNGHGGTVFELTPTTGGGWGETILHNFYETSTDGELPAGGLIFDSEGKLYGTTEIGGASAGGTVFDLSPAAGGVWTEKVLHSFVPNTGDGLGPVAGVIFDNAGNLFGATGGGGKYVVGMGTVFEIASTTVAAPAFSPAPGPYVVAQSVTITDGTPGATVYYTTNGTTPTTASTEYTKPIEVLESETIKTIAVAKGLTQSESSATYEIGQTLPAPTFSLAAGTYDTKQTVALEDTNSAAVIRYTITYATTGTTPTASSPVYTAPISVTRTATIEAFAAAIGYKNSAPVVRTYTITPPAATPIFSPAVGTYDSPQSVKITDSTPEATIYYTTNGSTPTTASARYTAPIAVTTTETLKAVAIAPGYSLSAPATATYIITPPAAKPTFTPIAGIYANALTVTIKDATPGAAIYWTLNSVKPSLSSAKYTGPIKVSATETINAIAIAPSYSESPEASALFTIETPAAAPTFTPAAGTYPVPQKVTIKDATPGAAIYYTTNGKTPTIASTPYTGPITVSSTETILAIAKAPGTLQSAVASATYTIAVVTEVFHTLHQAVTLTDYVTSYGSAPATLTWNVPFENANYRAVCIAEGTPADMTNSQGPILVQLSAKTATTIDVEVQADLTYSPSLYVDCIGVPNGYVGSLHGGSVPFSDNENTPLYGTLVWDVPLADNKYGVACSTSYPEYGLATYAFYTTKSATGMTVGWGLSGSAGYVDCIAAEPGISSAVRIGSASFTDSQTFPVLWNSSFPDTNYIAACAIGNPVDVNAGFAVILNTNALNTDSVGVTTAPAFTPETNGAASIDCLAVHTPLQD